MTTWKIKSNKNYECLTNPEYSILRVGRAEFMACHEDGWVSATGSLSWAKSVVEKEMRRRLVQPALVEEVRVDPWASCTIELT